MHILLGFLSVEGTSPCVLLWFWVQESLWLFGLVLCGRGVVIACEFCVYHRTSRPLHRTEHWPSRKSAKTPKTHTFETHLGSSEQHIHWRLSSATRRSKARSDYQRFSISTIHWKRKYCLQIIIYTAYLRPLKRQWFFQSTARIDCDCSVGFQIKQIALHLKVPLYFQIGSIFVVERWTTNCTWSL